MKQTLFLLAALTALSPAQAQSRDYQATVSSEQTLGVTLPLGPGALATITFPENVQDVITTRSGLVESKYVGQRVIIAGLIGLGDTPIQIVTENHVYNWRIVLKPDNQGGIVSVTVTPPPTTGTDASLPVASPVAAVPAATTTTVPQAAMIEYKAESTPQGTVLHYTVQAGTGDLTLDERRFTATASGASVVPQTKGNRTVVMAGKTVNGTLLLPKSVHGPVSLTWPYQVGTTTYANNQVIQVP